MKTKKWSMAAALALALVACGDENELAGDVQALDSPEEVSFSAGILSRASGSSWEAEDKVGISATGGGTSYSNVQYQVAEAGASVAFKPVAEAICYTADAPMSFTAYYPYAETLDNGFIYKNTMQTQEDVDFLWASVNDHPYSEAPVVSFTFRHRMALLEVQVTSDVDLSGQNVVIGGLKHDGGFNTATGEAKPKDEALTQEWTVGPSVSGNEFDFSGFIYPQAANELAVKIGEQEAKLSLGQNMFQAGYKYTVTATIDDGKISAQITINGNTIEGWEDAAGKIAFIGDAETSNALNDEEKAAYTWLKSNYTNVTVDYIPVTKADADLSDYSMVWAHWNNKPTDTYGIVATMKTYYDNGGHVLISRQAMNELVNLNLVQNEQNINKNFSDPINQALGYAPGIDIVDTTHPMFEGFAETHVNLRPINYYSHKMMLTWEFTDETARTAWASETGATILTQDGSNENTVTMAEFTNTAGGNVIAIGDPAFEWNKASEEAATTEIQNLYKLAKNTIDYLMQE